MDKQLESEIESVLQTKFTYDRLDEGLNDIFILSTNEEEYVLKIHTNPKNKIQWFRAEPEIYGIVNEETNIPSPDIIYKNLYLEQDQNAFYIMEKLEGNNPQHIRDKLNQEELEKIIFEYGRILGKIHSVQITNEYGIIGFENQEFGPPDSSDQWNWALEGAMSAWKQITEDEWNNPPNIEFDSEKIKQKIPSKPDSVLMHSDNRLDNILVKDEEITGFLDWSHPWSGHRLYDLVKTEYLLIERDLGDWQNEINLEKLKKSLYTGYKEETSFEEENFAEIERIYRYAFTLELAAGFSNWGAKLSEKEYSKVKNEIVTRIQQTQPKEFT